MEVYLKRIKDFASKLDPEVITSIEETYMIQKFVKGAFLLKPGQVCDGHFLINKGISRAYFLYEGKEITTAIYFEEDVAISLDSYVLKRESTIFIEALTEVEVTKVDAKRFQIAQKNHPELVVLDKLFIELHAVWFEKQLHDQRTLNATERYLNLIDKNPQIIQNVSLTIIASYLNISLETLSRIRSKISKQ